MSASTQRPYRSHKIPACDRCRARKIRCLADDVDSHCRSCAESGSECVRPKMIARGDNSLKIQSNRKRNRSMEQSVTTSSSTPVQVQSAFVRPSPAQTTLIVGPTVSEDLEVLESYLTRGGASVAPAPAHQCIRGARNQVYYYSIPRGRQGTAPANDAGKAQREILEQVLGPFCKDAILLYFRKIHACFPTMDETAFMELWRRGPSRISSTLMCDIYSASFLYWNSSKKLKHHRQPDLAFAWNLAVNALNEDFVAPTLSTLHAALIDLNGRPVLGISGNVLNIGRIVNLAQSLGLHRDPSTWNIPVAEKNMRIRLWWAVYIHDVWSSFAHGIPPSINRSFVDVPIPTYDHVRGVTVPRAFDDCLAFVGLCNLSRGLGNVLPVLYAINDDANDMSIVLLDEETKLDQWAGLPAFKDLGYNGQRIPGGFSLWFCYLLLRLLVSRLCKKVLKSSANNSTTYPAVKALGNRLPEYCADIFTFILRLDPEYLSEFWFPYIAHLLPSTVTISLSLITEMPTGGPRAEFQDLLKRFMETLHLFRRVHGWDIVDLCLERCADAVKRLAVSGTTDSLDIGSTSRELTLAATIPDLGDFLLANYENPWNLTWDDAWNDSLFQFDPRD